MNINDEIKRLMDEGKAREARDFTQEKLHCSHIEAEEYIATLLRPKPSDEPLSPFSRMLLALSNLPNWLLRSLLAIAALLSISLFVGFIALIFFGNNMEEGYVGFVFYLTMRLGCLIAAAILYYGEYKKPGRTWRHILYLTLSTFLGVYACIGLWAFGLDVIQGMPKQYTGRVHISRTTGRGAHCYVSLYNEHRAFWQGDLRINRSTYKRMRGVETATVVYWQHTGVVKSIAPAP